MLVLCHLPHRAIVSPSGHIPLRHLVYRVHALPGSMRPLIWDFGQLNHETEGLYTNQIVIRYVSICYVRVTSPLAPYI